MSAQVLINEASKFFLNDENILHILNNSSNITIQKTIREKVPIIEIIKKDDFFYPSDKHENTLFWCWYIFHNGIDSYHNTSNSIYQEEQKERISYITTIRKEKLKLKEIKMKRSIIENNIVYETNLSFNSILTLTYLFNYNFIYLTDKLYFENIIDSTSKTCIIKKIKNKNQNKTGIWINDKDFNILEEKNKRFQVENIEKPLKPISFYKKHQLEEI